MKLTARHGRKEAAKRGDAVITIARNVLHFIEQEVRQIPDELETGGLLLGRIGPEFKRVVLAASPPGPSAIHHPAMFERDLGFCQYILDEVYKLHQLVYVGEWHKHPRGCPQPSWRDAAGCRSILQDPAYKIDGFLLFPIFTVASEGAVEPHYYCMDHSRSFRSFVPALEDLKDFNDCVRRLESEYGTTSPRGSASESSQALQTQPAQSEQEGAERDIRHWYETPAGKGRLADIVEGLKSKGLALEPRVLSDGRLALAIKGPKAQEMIVVCAEAHPSAPPVIQVSSPANWNQAQTLMEYISTLHDFFAREQDERSNVLM